VRRPGLVSIPVSVSVSVPVPVLGRVGIEAVVAIEERPG